MFLTVIGAMVLARIKHYKIKYLFSTWTSYPILATICVFWFFQANVFAGNYYYVQYASEIKIASIVVYIFPIIVFELYKPAFAGVGLIAAGTLMNNFAIAQNGGNMPVFPSLSYLTGYTKPGAFEAVVDIHVQGDSAVKWKMLTDYIDVGYSVLSPGDVLIHMFSFIMIYYMIKTLNIKHESISNTEGKNDDE